MSCRKTYERFHHVTNMRADMVLNACPPHTLAPGSVLTNKRIREICGGQPKDNASLRSLKVLLCKLLYGSFSIDATISPVGVGIKSNEAYQEYQRELAEPFDKGEVADLICPMSGKFCSMAKCALCFQQSPKEEGAKPRLFCGLRALASYALPLLVKMNKG